MRVNANELAAFFFIRDHIVDGGFCGRARSRCNGNDRNALFLCGRHALKGNDIRKLRIIDDNTNTLGGILRGTTANGDHIIRPGLFKGFHTSLHNGNAGICLHLIKNFIGELVFIQQVSHLFHNTKTYKICIGDNQRFLKAARFDLRDDLLDSTRAVIACLIEDKTIGHDAKLLYKKCQTQVTSHVYGGENAILP